MGFSALPPPHSVFVSCLKPTNKRWFITGYRQKHMQTCGQEQRPVPLRFPSVPTYPEEMSSVGAGCDVVGSGAAALCRRNLPVIVAEICVQRVQIETHSHGGAHELRDHLSKPKWERNRDRNDWNQVPSSLCLCVSLSLWSLCYYALNSAARQQSSTGNAGHFPVSCKVCQSFPYHPLTHCAVKRVKPGEVEVQLSPGPARNGAHFCAAVPSVWASPCLGTGESRAGRRMWFSGRVSMRNGLCIGEKRWRVK